MEDIFSLFKKKSVNANRYWKKMEKEKNIYSKVLTCNFIGGRQI